MLKELAEENLTNFSQMKLHIIDKLMRKCVFLDEDQLLIIYRFSKVFLIEENSNDLVCSYDKNTRKSHSEKSALNKKDKDKKNDSNLSLNSTPNSKIENNYDWGIEEKGNLV